MNILTRRLIALAAAAAAALYVAVTHTIAADTYMKDRKEEDPDRDKKDQTEE